MEVVWPGDFLGNEGELAPGPNTYARDGGIYAATLGVRLTFRKEGAEEVAVLRPNSTPSLEVPREGQVVKGRVTRIAQRTATVELLLRQYEGAWLPLGGPFQGTIRQEHVRDKEIDKVVLPECFRPGDLVEAEVLGGGDDGPCLLATVKPGLGVDRAWGRRGEWLEPDGPAQFRSPTDGTVEPRKAARKDA